MAIDPPPQVDELEEQETQYQNLQAQESDEAFYGKEPSGFGFIALVAGLISLAAFGGIVIYSILLSPSAPRQPILIEAQGPTKSAPSGEQVKPEPNSDVGVFRMLRGGVETVKRQEQKPAPRRSISLKSATESSTESSPEDSTDNSPAAEEPEGAESEAENTSRESSNGSRESANGSRESSNGSRESAQDIAELATEPDFEQENTQITKPSLEEEEQKASIKTTAKTTPEKQGAWYVQVAALESEAAVDNAWTRLHDRMPELLYTQKYSAKRATLGSGKQVWRLLLGPQAKKDAVSLCRTLQKRSQSCIVKRITN